MRAIDELNRFLGERLCWLYLAAVAITAWEVVLRYVFNAPTSWGFELTILLCGICYLLSGGYVTLQGRHVAITALYDLMPAAGTLVARLIAGMLTGILAMGLLVWAAWGRASRRCGWSSAPAAPGTRRARRSSSR